MSPTFWLNDVIGETPKTPPEIADMNPSQQREPETSFFLFLNVFIEAWGRPDRPAMSGKFRKEHRWKQ